MKLRYLPRIIVLSLLLGTLACMILSVLVKIGNAILGW